MKAATLSVALFSALACTTAHAADRYLVVFKSDTLPVGASLDVAANGGKVNRAFPQVGVLAVSGDAAFAKRMAAHSKVLAVGAEHVFKLPDTALKLVSDEELAAAEAAPTVVDNLYGNQWDMRRIHAPAVWARLPVAGTQPRVAVLDTGVADDHPDLVGQVDATVSTTYCNTSGGANNSPSYPKYDSLIDFNAFPNWSPSDGCAAASTSYETHGTHVAGTIAAKFGGGRVVGVAPDAKIGAYKVFDRYRYTDPVDGLVDAVGAFDGPLFSAIILAAQAGYPVISMSLGSHVLRSDKGSNASWLAWDRIAKWANRNGALIVSSAGNSAYNLNGKLAHVPSDLPTVVNVSATTTSNLQVVGGEIIAGPGSDVLAYYSNYGSAVDISAPGGGCNGSPCYNQHYILNAGIRETAPIGTFVYYYLAGTSMATPHVSAVAAYVRSIHPEWTPGEVRSWLKESAESIGSRQAFGAGLVDADAAAR